MYVLNTVLKCCSSKSKQDSKLHHTHTHTHTHTQIVRLGFKNTTIDFLQEFSLNIRTQKR